MGFLAIFGFLAGVALLIGGADLLVRGASRLAAAFGISPVVIGLTVVAYGTGSPEMAISVQSSFAGTPDIALGNVVGSNICNVLLVLGLSAVAAPLVVEHRLLRFDAPVMLLLSGLVWGMALDERISRVEGALLFAGMIAYTVAVLRTSRSAPREEVEEYTEFVEEFVEPEDRTRVPWYKDAVFIVTGLGGLVLGAHLVVGAAVSFARALGVSELLVALTVVAVGTSLPEIVTSVVAVLHGEREIAVGNIIGSNIFNLLAVLGLAAAVSGAGVAVSPAATRFDLPVMTAVAALCLAVLLTHQMVTRLEGITLLALYTLYVACLIMMATQSPAPLMLERALLWVVPVTVLIYLISRFRLFSLHNTRKARKLAKTDEKGS